MRKKERLYNKLMILSDYHEELRPRKNDTIPMLLESYFYWADEYNDGYFRELDETDAFACWIKDEYQEWKWF